MFPKGASKLEAESGMSLLETMMAAGAVTLVVGALTSAMVNMNKTTRKAESSVDYLAIKNNVAQKVSCDRTFAGRPRGNPCPGGEYLRLIAANGAEVLAANGSKSPIGGGTNIVTRAYCGPGGLDVRSVSLLAPYVSNITDVTWAGSSRVANPSHYRQDELKFVPGVSPDAQQPDVAYSWNHPKSRLFPLTGPNALCSDWFMGGAIPAPCANGQIVTNINFDDKSATCATVPDCLPPNMLKRSGNTFECSPSSVLDTVIDNRIIALFPTLITNYMNSYAMQNTPETSVRGSNDSECASLSRMKCPRGYAMWGYEALMSTAGHHCSLSCKKIWP